MAVFFNSSESEVSFEVGVYEEIPKPESKDTTAAKAPQPKFNYFRLVVVSFGLLCVLQAILNITLRLTMSQSPETGATVGESCPQDWLRFESSCYYISPQRKNWDDSRLYCTQNDADLVIINSTQEQAFLTGFSMAVWIGMTDRDKEGTWIWVNGKPVDKNGLQFAPGQPDDAYGGEDCGDIRTMKNFIGLNDSNCTVRAQWICEKPLLESDILQHGET